MMTKNQLEKEFLKYFQGGDYHHEITLDSNGSERSDYCYVFLNNLLDMLEQVMQRIYNLEPRVWIKKTNIFSEVSL